MAKMNWITRLRLWLAYQLVGAHLEEQVDEFKDALIWCSGSADFQEGGKARKGWLKIAHLLK